MTWYEILIISVGLSLDVFAYALYKGAMLSHLEWKKISMMTAVFAVWQAAAMSVGSLVADIPVIAAHYAGAEKLYDILSAVIFFGVGILMMGKAAQLKEVMERREDNFYMKQLCAWAAITSIDSFLTGVSMGFLNTELWILLVQLFIVTVGTTLLGIWVGYRMGCHTRRGFLRLGGAIFLLAGIDVLIRYYG